MAKKNTAFQAKNVLPTVKHGGGSIMVYGTMAVSGFGILRFIDVIIDGIIGIYRWISVCMFIF